VGKSWEQVRRENPVNENNLALYDRMLAIEQKLEPLRRLRGLGADAWEGAWAASNQDDPRLERDDDLLSVARYVQMLGGRLELRAVFGDEEVVLLTEPAPPGAERASPNARSDSGCH
jgi:hypothetical protein